MAPLIDYLGPLHQGTWEVVVPKEVVTEPLEPSWARSPINVPSPNTLASYRNGQYHAHETADDFRVHLDRYDPSKNPVMHLVDDAPLVLMIFETLETLAVSARDARHDDQVARLADLRLTGWTRLALGALLVGLGALLLVMAFGKIEFVFSLVIPGVVAAIGALLVFNGLRLRARGEHSGKDVMHGLILLAGGWFLLVTWELYVVLILLLLAVWLISSAAVSLHRVVRSRDRIPQGVVFTAGLGAASLVLGWMAFTEPVELIELLVLLLGVIVLAAGGILALDGLGMRNAAHLIEGGRAGEMA